jgi:hypothetical protein
LIAGVRKGRKMETDLNSAGYDLWEIGDNEWLLDVKGTNKVYTGTFKEVVKFAVERLGFKLETFNEAIEVFIPKQELEGHNGIHFGMYKSFIYTFKREYWERKRSS